MITPSDQGATAALLAERGVEEQANHGEDMDMQVITHYSGNELGGHYSEGAQTLVCSL